MTAELGDRFPGGTFKPAPGRGRPLRMLAAQTRIETLLIVRHGEQALLTLIIPIALLIGMSVIHIGDLPEPRVNSVMPRILALAVMSTAFTGQAIALGFDRRYGVLKRLSATALPRWTLISGRVLATLLVVALQAVVLGVTALLLGWSPALAGLLPGAGLLVLGTLVFGAAGVLVGGSLRPEIVLALANAIWFVLLLAGGLALPAEDLPGPLSTIAGFLPSGALAEALDAGLVHGALPGVQPILVLLAWGVACGATALRTTKLT
ncbi:ABC transporter permease [Saccharopolyspora tripterygii]